MTAVASAPSLADRLSALPRFYTWRTLLTDVFDDDEDAFAAAWVSGALPADVRRAVDLPHPVLQTWLLARMTRQLDTLISLLQAPGEVTVFADPPPQGPAPRPA